MPWQFLWCLSHRFVEGKLCLDHQKCLVFLKALFDSPTRTTNMKIVQRQLIPPSAFLVSLAFSLDVASRKEKIEKQGRSQTLSSTHAYYLSSGSWSLV